MHQIHETYKSGPPPAEVTILENEAGIAQGVLIDGTPLPRTVSVAVKWPLADIPVVTVKFHANVSREPWQR